MNIQGKHPISYHFDFGYDFLVIALIHDSANDFSKVYSMDISYHVSYTHKLVLQTWNIEYILNAFLISNLCQNIDAAFPFNRDFVAIPQDDISFYILIKTSKHINISSHMITTTRI